MCTLGLEQLGAAHRVAPESPLPPSHLAVEGMTCTRGGELSSKSAGKDITF